MSKYIYIIDPGHGGINPGTGQPVTPGKRSPIWEDGSQYIEGVGNREIAEFLAACLKDAGIRYDFTVHPDNWRDLALHKRVNRVNKLVAQHKHCVVISIHSNASDNSTAHGFEVWTSPGQTTSDKLAELWFWKYANAFPNRIGRKDTLKDGDVDKEAKFTILTATNCPAILIESMFHTNPEECKLLMDVGTKVMIAKATCEAIIEFENQLKAQ